MIQLPYALQVIQPLKELFLQDNFNEIPDIILKPNTDLSLISSNVASLAVSTSSNNDIKTQVVDIFDGIGEYFQDNRNLLRLQSIEYISKSFAGVLENSYSTLNDVIAPTVDSIKKDIIARYIDLMTREKAEGLITSVTVEPHENDYTFVNWGSLASPAYQNEVIDTACFNANISQPALSPLCLAYISRKANFTPEFKELNIPLEVSETILGKLKAVSEGVEGVHDDTVALAWKIFTDRTAYDNFCRQLSDKFLNVKHTVPNSIEILHLVEAVSAMITPVKNVASEDLSGNTMQDLASNIDVVNKTLYAARYWLLINKEVKFKNKLILTPNIINDETYQEFVSGGKSISDVHNYLKAFHLGTSIPMDGIDINTVREANVNERLEKASAKLRSNEVYITSKCLISAYEFGIAKFIKSGDMAALFPHAADQSFGIKFSRHALKRASFLGGKLANLDTVLYDVIINEFYKDSLIASMYKYLGTSFDNLADNVEGDITDERITEAQCEAIGDLIIDYLFKMTVESGKA